jgi:hypothetical protein
MFRTQANVRVLLGEVTPVLRQIALGETRLAYDFLIIATGARHSYFGHDDWAPAAPGLKGFEDALDIRRRLLFTFEAAESSQDEAERRAWLTFIIIRGGPTGVELAGAIAEGLTSHAPAANYERHNITRFKSLPLALKELEPFIRNGHHLESGRPFKRLDMRSREAFANWLLSVVGNFAFGLDFTFTSDPRGGDGIIYDSITQQAVWTEHVMVRGATRDDKQDAQTRILKAVAQKIKKGRAAYASGKTLVVFLFSGTAGAQWWPKKVAAALPDPLYFDAVRVVGFQRFEADDWIYGVTRLDLRAGSAPAWWVRIASDFNSWVVLAAGGAA